MQTPIVPIIGPRNFTVCHVGCARAHVQTAPERAQYASDERQSSHRDNRWLC
jgi:hypothetical protein